MIIKIKIKDLKLFVNVGVEKLERATKQPVIMELLIKLNWNKKDDINNTIDYDLLASKLLELVKDKEFILLESLAKFIIDYLKNNYNNIIAGRVSLYKDNLVDRIKATVELEF